MTRPPGPARADVAAGVQRLIRRRVPATHRTTLFAADVSIGPEGLGLDSIGTAELLLECEREFGVTISTELLERGPLTVGALTRFVMQAAATVRPAPGPA